MNCPVDFYFNNVLKIKGEGDDDEVGMDVVGTAAHFVLQKIYETETDQSFGANKIDYSDERIIGLIKESFEKSGIVSMKTGKPLLMEKVILKMVKTFIDADLLRHKGKMQLDGLERKLKSEIILENGRKVVLSGTFDRIELAENGSVVRIMDYKTGSVDSKDISIGDPSNLIDVDAWFESDYDYWSKKLQLLCYGYIAKRTERYKEKTIKMGIYSLRSPSKVFMLKYGSRGIEKSLQKMDFIYTDEADTVFTEILKKIAGEIFDSSKPFRKKNSEKLYCKW